MRLCCERGDCLSRGGGGPERAVDGLASFFDSRLAISWHSLNLHLTYVLIDIGRSAAGGLGDGTRRELVDLCVSSVCSEQDYQIPSAALGTLGSAGRIEPCCAHSIAGRLKLAGGFKPPRRNASLRGCLAEPTAKWPQRRMAPSLDFEFGGRFIPRNIQELHKEPRRRHNLCCLVSDNVRW